MQVQAAIGAFDSTYNAVKSSHDSKKTNIERMKEDIDRMEKETEAKLKEIDDNNTKLNVSDVTACIYTLLIMKLWRVMLQIILHEVTSQSDFIMKSKFYIR